MESVIIADFGTVLGKTSERLVVRGPRPRLELIAGEIALVDDSDSWVYCSDITTSTRRVPCGSDCGKRINGFPRL